MLIVLIRAAALGLLPGLGLSLTIAAQGPRISGSVAVSYGQLNDGSNITQEGAGEAVLDFSAKSGQVSARFELEVNDETALENARHAIVWRTSPSTRITLSGQSFGIPSASGNISVVKGAAGAVGDEKANLNFKDTGLFNIEWSPGGITAGLAFLDGCVPECGYVADAAAPGGVLFSGAERRAIILHLRGKAGGLDYNLYTADSSGRIVDASLPAGRPGRGRGTGLGLEFNSSAIYFGLDASMAFIQCAEDTVPPCQHNRIKEWGVAIEAGVFGAHYFFGEQRLGVSGTETVNVDLVAAFPVSENATVGPELRVTRTIPFSGSGTAAHTTQSYALLGMLLEF